MPRTARRSSPLARLALATASLVAATVAPITLAAQSGSNTSNRVYRFYQRSGDVPRGVHVDATLCGPTPATIDGNCGIAGLHAYAHAAATTGGVLKAQASLSATGARVELSPSVPADADNAGYTAGAFAGMWDRVTFGGIAPAVIRVNYVIDGELTNVRLPSGAGYVNSGVDLFFRARQGAPVWDLPNARLFRTTLIGRTSQSATVAETGYVDFALDGAAPLFFHFGLSAFVDLGLGGLRQDVVAGMGDADFFNTALFGVQALDANGADVTAAAGLVFESGAGYPVSPTATVPEPGTVVLVATGLLAVAGTDRRRRSGALAGAAAA